MSSTEALGVMARVNPAHYRDHKVTAIDLIDEYGLGFRLGNVIKYVSRHAEKDGVADLCKAGWYLLTELGMSKDEARDLLQALVERDPSLRGASLGGLSLGERCLEVGG